MIKLFILVLLLMFLIWMAYLAWSQLRDDRRRRNLTVKDTLREMLERENRQ